MSNNKEQTILHIEDNPGDCMLMKVMLNEITPTKYHYISAETLKEGCEQLKQNMISIILLDLNLPDSIGKLTFDTLAASAENIPIVLISGNDDKELSLVLIKEGAQDFILKKDLTANLLEKTIRYAIERQKYKDELKESEEKYRYLVDNLNSGLAIYSLDGEILYFNKKAIENTGGKLDDYLGKSLLVCFEDHGQNYINRIKEVAKSDVSLEYEDFLQTINGDKYFYSIQTRIKDINGNVTGVQVLVNDITEKRLAEMELIKAKEQAEESDRNYKLIFNSTETANSVFDKNCNLILQNKLSQEYLGLGEEDAIGKSVFEIFGQEAGKEIYERMNGVLNTGISEIFETEFDLPSGTNWFRSTYIPIFDENKTTKSIQVISQNITEIKNTQLELIKAKEQAEESNRLKSAFLANMSHEIRTPMNGILGFAELLKSPKLSGDEQQEFIKIIEKSGNRMLNIINDIISISKIESGIIETNISDVDINDQLHFIYIFFNPEAEKKGIQFTINNNIFSSNFIIKSDKEKIYAILTNLVKNAIKYTDSGSIELSCDVVDNEIHFNVKDTGIGIPLDRQEAIFERFMQAEIEDRFARQGAGLGLAIAKAYIELLGGKIWLESEEGAGSVFSFSIPINQLNENNVIVNKTIPEVQNKLVSNNLKILIVEDDEMSDLLLTRILSEYGYEFLHAKTGFEAIDILHKEKDIDLILMDINMPGLDGYEATRQIREFNTDIIIFAQTAYAMKGDKEIFLEAGFNEYLAKPLNRIELLLTIEKYFGN